MPLSKMLARIKRGSVCAMMGFEHTCKDCETLRGTCTQTKNKLDELRDVLVNMVMSGTFDSNMRKGKGMRATYAMAETEAEKRVNEKVIKARAQASEHVDGLISIEPTPLRRLLEVEAEFAAATKEYQTHVGVLNARRQLREDQKR